MIDEEETGIDGVKLVLLTKREDERGYFYEAFRTSWFANRPWAQWNVSHSTGSVVRGLHFHKLQTDFWVVPEGKITVALVDLRPRFADPSGRQDDPPIRGRAQGLVYSARGFARISDRGVGNDYVLGGRRIYRQG